MGDILGVEGLPRKTPKGVLTVEADKLVMLAKALVPLPSKFRGMTNPDLRFRRRHVDLISNRDAASALVGRSRIVSEIRRGLEQRGYLEVDTPILHPVATGADAQPFSTHHHAVGIVTKKCYDSLFPAESKSVPENRSRALSQETAHWRSFEQGNITAAIACAVTETVLLPDI